MAQNGLFRNAMSGFNKQDVLQYIDVITGAWNVERGELEQAAEAASAAAQEMAVSLKKAQDEAAINEQRMVVAETQLSEAQQQLFDATADLANCRALIEELTAQLEEAQKSITRLEAEVETVSNQRDDAIAAVADAREQIAVQSDAVNQLEGCRQRMQQQDEQITAMQQAITRYENVLGSADTAHQRVDGIVRPFIEQANRQADETLDSVQAVLAGVLAQLGELQGSVEQRRQALRRCKKDSDTRLSSAFGDWLAPTKDINPYDRHFFR